MATKKNKKPDPILDDAPTVEIAGETYTVQRLSFRHAFRVGKILRGGMHVLGNADYGPGQILQVLIACMTENEDAVLALIADLIGVDRKDLDDPERFPMPALVDVFGVIAENQDLKDFLDNIEKLTERLPEMRTA